MSQLVMATRADSISYVGAHIGDRAYSITAINGRADQIARHVSGDHFLTIWLASKTPPTQEAIAALEAAGFSTEFPHGAVQ